MTGIHDENIARNKEQLIYLIQKTVAVKSYDSLRGTPEILCTYIYESSA
jgi:hypothetical protein